MRLSEIQKHHKNGNKSGNESNNRKPFQLMLNGMERRPIFLMWVLFQNS